MAKKIYREPHAQWFSRKWDQARHGKHTSTTIALRGFEINFEIYLGYIVKLCLKTKWDWLVSQINISCLPVLLGEKITTQ